MGASLLPVAKSIYYNVLRFFSEILFLGQRLLFVIPRTMFMLRSIP